MPFPVERPYSLPISCKTKAREREEREKKGRSDEEQLRCDGSYQEPRPSAGVAADVSESSDQGGRILRTVLVLLHSTTHAQPKDAIGVGAYDPLGHRQEQFLGAANLGPFPDAFKEAWQTMHIEARENSGLSPDSPQEELQAALGCLADPDPARARGRSAPCARPCNDEGAPPDLSQGEDGSIPGDAGASEGNGAAQEGDSSEPVVTQRSLSEVLDRSRANLLQEELAARDQDDEHRRAWYQVDQSSSSIIWAIPTDWNKLQPEQFIGQRCNSTLASRNRAWLAWRGNPFPKSGRGAVHVPRSSAIRTVRTYAR